ncbi:ABC transporter ATP-binding protein [Gemmatimonadota bacterium]
MIVVKALRKTFKLSRQQKREMGKGFAGSTIDAVRDIDFQCQPGRIFALLGPNGAGKTTTLRMIATMLKPSAGTIGVLGHDTVQQPREVRRRMGFLTGDTGLYHRLTPTELVKYFADLYGMEKKTYERRREELFSLLDMHDFANRRIGKLSSGMRQKVSIVRTMIHDPEALIFDEPTVGLDVVTSRNIIQLIRNCKDAGKTVIFSTHRMGEVSLLSDDLAIIHQGRLCFNDTYENFLSRMQARSVEDEFIRLVGEN